MRSLLSSLAVTMVLSAFVQAYFPHADTNQICKQNEIGKITCGHDKKAVNKCMAQPSGAPLWTYQYSCGECDPSISGSTIDCYNSFKIRGDVSIEDEFGQKIDEEGQKAKRDSTPDAQTVTEIHTVTVTHEHSHKKQGTKKKRAPALTEHPAGTKREKEI